MPLGQGQFEYSVENIDRLESSISSDRLSTYLQLTQQDKVKAISLYEWNISMSEALYGLLQGLEITLRNSIHRVLSDAFGRGDWYEVMPLYIDQRNAIIDAKKKLTGNSKSLHPHRMIAELTFGFWTSLTGPRYAQTLWDTYLKNAFPESNVGRKAAQKRLRKIRFLRNRIAHHECIVGLHPDGQPRNLEQDERDIMDTIRWICPVTEKWIKSTSSFAERFAKRPQV